jgi:hypothetical protein
MKRAIILPALVTAFVALSPAGVALANNPHDHGNTGQPDQSIESQPLHQAGFDTGGFATAEEHYAGENTGLPDAANPNGHAVSQYDVAAFQFSNTRP